MRQQLTISKVLADVPGDVTNKEMPAQRPSLIVELGILVSWVTKEFNSIEVVIYYLSSRVEELKLLTGYSRICQRANSLRVS
jgi:hypothetical protein